MLFNAFKQSGIKYFFALIGFFAVPIVYAADASHPTVVELFQSQGCSSCPPANANVNAISQRSDILALSFAVTYWDQLGWKDTFAKPQYTERQWEYARGLHHDEVWTPQVIINGRTDIVGTRRKDLEDAIVKADRGLGGPNITITSSTVEVSGSVGEPADVWLVRYDSKTVDIAISRGENNGRTLPHKNIVRELVRLGRWQGGKTIFSIPAMSLPGLSTAAFIQVGRGGKIISAARG